MSGLVKAVIALGSNLNQPKKQVQAALKRLDDVEQIKIISTSSLYITAPVGYVDQPDFVNAVVLVETSMAPEKLLAKLLEIELEFGRTRSFVNAPRLLDLDLIDYDHQIMVTENLTLPHPRAFERGFVMFPLCEIAPDYVLGGLPSVKEIVKHLSIDGVHLESGTLTC